MNIRVDFDINNQTSFLIHAGGTKYFSLSFSGNGITYKYSSDNGLTWVDIFTK